MLNRRNLLKLFGLGSLVFLESSCKSYPIIDLSDWSDRYLILVHLAGGIDGLHAVVPIENKEYYEGRPNTAISPRRTLQISSNCGLHPNLSGLYDLLQDGEMTILRDVGYPEPILSHFHSSDVWHSGSKLSKESNTGWIGRLLDQRSDLSPLYSVQFDSQLELVLQGKKNSGFAYEKKGNIISFLRNISSTSKFNSKIETPINQLYKVLNDTQKAYQNVINNYKVHSYSEYAPSAIRKQFQEVVNFIGSGLPTRIFYTQLGGFDTHVNQVNRLDGLLNKVDNNLSALVHDLKLLDVFDRTIIMVYSEFGRRVYENNAGGTDHGTANPVFIISGSLRPRKFDKICSRMEIDSKGNLNYESDFRNLYSTILEKWFEVPGSKILDGNYNPMEWLIY